MKITKSFTPKNAKAWRTWLEKNHTRETEVWLVYYKPSSGRVNITDAIFTIQSLFVGGVDVECDDACDSNDDGTVNISDVMMSLGALFLGEGTIAAPGMAGCGADPTDDGIGCDRPERCP